MKLDKHALIEIMHIVQTGFFEQKDISEMLRELDFEADDVPHGEGEAELTLSAAYLAAHPRQGDPK